MPLNEAVPHLDEAYRLAQVIAHDRNAATDLVLRAYETCGVGRGSRFSVLRAVIAASGVTWPRLTVEDDGAAAPVNDEGASAPENQDRSAAPVDDEKAAAPVNPVDDTAGLQPPEDRPAEVSERIRPEPGDATESSVSEDGSGLPAPAVSDPPAQTGLLLRDIAGRVLRDRALPASLASLDARDRIACWLEANALGNPSDAGAVLGLSAGEALVVLVAGRRALESTLYEGLTSRDATLMLRASMAEPLPEAVKRVLDSVLERAPAALTDRLRPAAPSVQPSDRPSRRTFSFGVAFRILAFIASAALVGYAIRSFRPASPKVSARADLVERVMEIAPATNLSFRTSSAEQAEVFVRDRVGWRIVVPSVEGSVLEGVGVTVLGSGSEVPVLHFDGARPVVMIVVTYAYLDSVTPRLTIDEAILDQIGGEGRFSILDSGPRRATIFRNRDDIFVAVTASDVRDLDQAITFPG